MVKKSISDDLIGRCLAGDEGAWVRLYADCQPVLLSQIRSWLGPWRRCGSLADEIAARVWLKVIEQGCGRLARFDPTFGTKITTFLVAIARREFLMALREEARRAAREAVGASRRPNAVTDDRVELELADYLEQLDEPERRVVVSHLSGENVGGGANPARAGANVQKLLLNLRAYLSRSSDIEAESVSETDTCACDENNSSASSFGGI